MADASLHELAGPAVAATFVAADPPRDSWLALWPLAGDAEGKDAARRLTPTDELELAVPAGTQVRRKKVAVHRVPLAEALDALVELPAGAEVGRSVRAWAAAARIAVELAARGRLQPGVTPTGTDTWRVGPLDPDDHRRQGELARALPPEAHAVALPGHRPLRIGSADVAVAAFADAVADLLPRTASAPAAAGHVAFARSSSLGERRPDVDGGRPMTPDTGAGRRGAADRHAPSVGPMAEGGSSPRLEGATAAWLAGLRPSTDAVVVALRLEPPLDEADPFRAALQLQSAADPSLVLDAADLWDAPDVVLERFPEGETDLLLALRRGARTWPPLQRLLDEARPTALEVSDEEADDLLGPVVDDLAGAGIQVLWPKELVDDLTLTAVASSTPAPAGVAETGFSLEDLLELRWTAAIGGEALTAAELAALAEAKRPVVRLRGRWVRADPERLARLRQRRRLSAGEVLAASLGAELVIDGEALEVELEGPLAGLTERLAAFDPTHALPAPAGLGAELRPYQQRGVAWLAEMADLGLGGVLADDMGLGKTVQLLALHLHRHPPAPVPEPDGDPGSEGDAPGRPTLVVCPASVLANWEREAARFAPHIPVRRYHGAGRSLDDLAPDELVVATYGMVRRDAERLAEVHWGLIAADEAQAVKNPLARTAKALRKLPADARFALTGTPVENRLTELWALLDWTTPGLLGPLEPFRRKVALPIERYRDPEATEALTRVTRPFLLRRRKSDPTIVPELPPKTEVDRIVPLSVEQASLYKAVTEEALATIAETEGIERRGLVLKLLTALKQICNHPAQYLHQPGPLVERSGKLDATVELLDIIADEGAAALVFTQYVEMGRLLEQHLAAHGLRTFFLHGSLGVRRRQELVDRFQAGEADAFVISLKAGGTGLNLTQASHVVHFDRWWNPAVEDQASDRAWRIGQDRPVTVHRLICEGTVEDRIAALLEDKRALADAVVGSGEGWISELDDRALADLVRLAEPVGAGQAASASGPASPAPSPSAPTSSPPSTATPSRGGLSLVPPLADNDTDAEDA
ncbi:MAG: DEAD/DEAH box helicase [Acidimicrobiales bacterium]|nr:DEAD/DEAH box helicase [Acidimicrobiales bacterium]